MLEEGYRLAQVSWILAASPTILTLGTFLSYLLLEAFPSPDLELCRGFDTEALRMGLDPSWCKNPILKGT